MTRAILVPLELLNLHLHNRNRSRSLSNGSAGFKIWEPSLADTGRLPSDSSILLQLLGVPVNRVN
jgi:hypothetical protein